MKQIIPFTKDIAFKTKVEEITSISLDHDLQLKGEDTITGNFFIKGKFKMTKESQIEEDFSYKIPCEISISDDYDTFDATVDIDDFYYNLLDDEILKVNIAVVINNLVKKEVIIKENNSNREEKSDLKENIKKEDIKIDVDDGRLTDIVLDYEKEVKDNINPINVIAETKKEIFNYNDNDTYSTYYVYVTKEGDTYDSIANKYNIAKDDIFLYNDNVDIKKDIKLIIPESNNG